MSDEAKFWLYFWLIVGLCIVTIVISGLIYNYATTQAVLKAGYEEVYDAQYRRPLWKKVREAKDE